MDNETGHAENAAKTTRVRKNRRSLWLVAGGIAVLAIGGVGAANAMAGRVGFMGGHVGPGMGFHGFAEHGISRALDIADVSAQQKVEINGIVDALQDDIEPLLVGFGDARERAMGLLTAETIDRDALETLRTESIAAIDAATLRASAALVQVAELLTPEQRAELGKGLGDGFGPGRNW